MFATLNYLESNKGGTKKQIKVIEMPLYPTWGNKFS